MAETVQRIVTSGTFSLDGGTWEVDNNVWLIGNNTSVIIIDPAHSIDKIAEVVAGRRVEKILLTHAHDDHISSAQEAAHLFHAPVFLNSRDRPLWKMVYPDWDFDQDLHEIPRIVIGSTVLQVLETPGHTPGSVCFYAANLLWENSRGLVFSGDTLFAGGPGATGRSWSDFPTIIASIEHKLLALPPSTVVLPGHGETTEIGVEAPHLTDWIRRGY